MASVFLSYDREDADKARPIAAALEKAGHSVWWDRHIKGGAQYSKEIEQALKVADTVVVLWSERSVDSAWVRDEAAAGRDSGRLMPVSLDRTEPPLGFRQFQTIDLSGRRARAASLRELATAIDALGNGVAPAGHPPVHDSSWILDRKWFALGLIALLAIVAAYFAWSKLGSNDSGPSVAVTAADPSARTQTLARDLLVKLGSLQGTQTAPVRMVESADRANLVLRVGAAQHVEKAGASLLLLSNREGSVLWSKDFEQPSGKQADLQQQVAVTAARILACALEALGTSGRRLRPELTTTYLNACASLEETFAHDTSQVIPLLLEVVQGSPDFEPAWAKLLIAETDRFVALERPEKGRIEQTLRHHVAEAQKLNRNMPEALLAQAELQPGTALFDRMALIDRAARIAPDNVYVLSARANLLMDAGRMSAAVDDAHSAATLDPLSPAMRNLYIGTLAYAGRTDDAKAQLLEAERLWPGATTVTDARYRYSLRFGDPADAIQMERSGEILGGRIRQTFLKARAEPTKANIDEAVRITWAVYRRAPQAIGDLMQTLGEFGREEELFPILLQWRDKEEIPYIADILFRPSLAGLRKDPRFMQVANTMGLVDYWRRSDRWPDFCIDPDLPYDCEKEAAKLLA